MMWYFPKIVFFVNLNLEDQSFWTGVIKTTKKNGWSQQWSEAFLELLAGCVTCIKMLSLTVKYDNDSIKYKVCMEMLIGKSVTNFNDINKCSFDFFNQFIY